MKRRIMTVALLSGLLWMPLAAWADEAAANATPPGERPMLALKTLPSSPDAYQEDVAALWRKGVAQRHGLAEWTAIVLTHEIHQHIGIYTIIGAKMGTRARELLKAPMRAVRVSVETGNDKTKACASDGIQVALGSTYAQGLITQIAHPGAPLQGVFEYEGAQLTLSLKPERQIEIDRIIETAKKKHGFLTADYFEEVEHASYAVWEDFDRTQIFNERLAPPLPNRKE